MKIIEKNEKAVEQTDEKIAKMVDVFIEQIAIFKKGGKNWIQGAVNPKHKGYCTPMTKKTCTSHRKALAKRFKAGI